MSDRAWTQETTVRTTEKITFHEFVLALGLPSDTDYLEIRVMGRDGSQRIDTVIMGVDLTPALKLTTRLTSRSHGGGAGKA